MTTTQDRLSMPLGEAIFSQRAIRRVRPDPIPEEDLQHILEAAIHAPNGGNQQPWRFIVLRDPEVKAKFATLYEEAWWAKRKDEGINGPQDIAPGKGSQQSAMRLSKEIGQAPVIVLLCATRLGAGAAASIVPASQNLLLAARALGIGGTITTLHAVVDQRARELFGLPENGQIVYALPLGYPKGSFGTTSRKPLDEVVSYDRW
jgi:nitroreductase